MGQLQTKVDKIMNLLKKQVFHKIKKQRQSNAYLYFQREYIGECKSINL